jgi:hypothetical protein
MSVLHFSRDDRHADDLPRRSIKTSLLILAMLAGPSAFAAEEADAPPAPATPSQAGGLVMFDYQAIKIKGYPSIDLMGFHVLNKFDDWLYVGVGGHAPLFKGAYGGFMAFDVSVHAEQKLFGNWSAAVGASLGGGGGGKDTEQSKTLSGSGGFVKSYVGLGYRLNDMSVGVNYSKVRFTRSVIDGSQFGLFIQTPFSYAVAPYAHAGRRFLSSQESGPDSSSDHSDEDVVLFGLDNIIQINPKGTNKKTVNLVDVQYRHFLADDYYVLFGGSVGYHGIAGYNQVYGGLGYQYAMSSRTNISLQLAIGSGGYSPAKIDTGSGLLIFPKLSTEYRLNDQLGLALSGGYLHAPDGSSRNMTLGASLVYRPSSNGGASSGNPSATERDFNGHRIHAFLQTQYKVKVGDKRQSELKLLTVQIDNTRRDDTYIPVQGSIAYGSYLGYPGYGELLAGIGVQSKYSADTPFQTFAQMLIGTNIHGIIVKPAVGANWGLSDRLAIYGQAGGTISLDKLGLYPKQYRFRSTSLGLGLSYRFSLLQ